MVQPNIQNDPALYRLIAEQFGVQTRGVPVVRSITTAASVVMRNNPTRLGFGLYNLFTSTMFVNLDSTVSSSNGISIAASPGNLTMVYHDDFHLVGQEWWAISPSGIGNLMVVEVVATR